MQVGVYIKGRVCPFSSLTQPVLKSFELPRLRVPKSWLLCTGHFRLAWLTQVRDFRGLWHDSKEMSGRLCPTRLTEIKDFRGPTRGLWHDSKGKSGVWSEVMGLWACKAACRCDFH